MNALERVVRQRARASEHTRQPSRHVNHSQSQTIFRFCDGSALAREPLKTKDYLVVVSMFI